MTDHMISTAHAIAAAERKGYVAKRSAIGKRLHVYTGEADQPGTWIEVAVTMIDDSDRVSRHALRDIL